MTTHDYMQSIYKCHDFSSHVRSRVLKFGKGELWFVSQSELNRCRGAQPKKVILDEGMHIAWWIEQEFKALER